MSLRLYLAPPPQRESVLWTVVGYPLPAGAHILLGRFYAFTPEEALARAQAWLAPALAESGVVYALSSDPHEAWPSTTADLWRQLEPHEADAFPEESDEEATP